MQISRHWRLNPLRYRLQGVRYADGAVSIQPRPVSAAIPDETPTLHTEKPAQLVKAHVA